MHDIVIVGAGPAGASFAKFSAERGFDVAIIDLLDFSRVWSKPCGDAIDEATFRTLGMKPPSGGEVEQKVKGLDVYSTDYKSSVRMKEKGYMVNRTALGQRLVKEAIGGGAEFFERTAFKKPIIEEGKVCGVVAVRDGKPLEFRSHLVVDCTGDAAVVKSRLPEEWPVAEKTKYRMLCFRGKARIGDIEDPEYLRIYTDQKLAPKAYWWFFPEGPGKANMGLGVRPEDRGILMKNYREIVSKFPVTGMIEESGAYVPVQRPVQSLVGPGVLALGDAAPTINPLSGGGISSTFLAAHVAASRLDEVAAGGWSYEAAWAMNDVMRKVGSQLAVSDVAKTALWGMSEEQINRGVKLLKKGLNLASLLLDSHFRKLGLLAIRVRNHYRSYPKKPAGLPEWKEKSDKLFASLNF